MCTKCRGTGAKNPSDVKTCPVCKGQGYTIVTAKMGPGFVSQMQQPCDKCGSKGKIVTSKCSVCGGSKVMHGTDEFQVAVERGMADGEQITFARQGPQFPPLFFLFLFFYVLLFLLVFLRFFLTFMFVKLANPVMQ